MGELFLPIVSGFCTGVLGGSSVSFGLNPRFVWSTLVTVGRRVLGG